MYTHGQDATEDRARGDLQHFLQENAPQLQAILCGYVAKMGLATGENIQVVAAEVFQDAALETLEHANHFNPDMQPRAWFLSIAAHILKRHRASYAKRYRFEVLVSSLADKAELEPDQDVLDRLMAVGNSTPGPEQGLVARESADALLSLVSHEDAQLLNLALVSGWNTRMLAASLNVPPGAVRVRLHRALSRLRTAWRISEQQKEYSNG